MELHQGVLGGQGLEFVLGRAELVSSVFRDLGSHLFGKAFVGVEAGADSSAALGQLGDFRDLGGDSPDALSYLVGIAPEFLA